MDGISDANITLQHNGQTVKANIMKRDIGTEGKPIGRYTHNTIFNSRKYEVKLPDGLVDEYHHNILLENLLSQVEK